MRRRCRRSRWAFAGLLAAGLFASAAEPARAASSFRKGPFLQALDDRSVVIKIELDAEAPVAIDVKAPDGKVTSFADAEKRAFHAVLVNGLASATPYTYEAKASGEIAKGSFTTAPSDGRPFRFLVYGDTRSDKEAHEGVVKALLAARGAFLVNTGDLVATGDDASAWNSFFDIERELLANRCLFTCIGNHELYPDVEKSGATFRKYFALQPDTLYGSFRWGNTRFFLLNAMDDFRSSEKAWLTDQLDKASVEAGVQHRFVVLHWSPFSSGPHGANVALAKAGILDLFDKDKVDLVIAGHDHIYERGTGPRGLKYVISGGGGAPLYQRKSKASETQRFESLHHTLEFAIDGEKVSYVARALSGAVIETCGFEGASAWKCEGGTVTTKDDGTTPPPAPEPASSAPKASGKACSCDAIGGGDDGAIPGLLFLVAGAWAARRKRALPKDPADR